MSDLNMLACTGRQERTEFRALLASAGLAADAVTRCEPPLSYIVFRAVPAAVSTRP
jgi:hypothetical protein